MGDLCLFLDQSDIGLRTRQQFLLIVSEAFTNALIHGNKSDPAKKIKVHIHINSKALFADIIDQGLEGLTRIRNKRSADLLAESGRGIDLMKHYCDKVKFMETRESGLKVRLRIQQAEKESAQIVNTGGGHGIKDN